MKLIGVYIVDNNPDVHIVEVSFNDSPANVKIWQITQEIERQSSDSWQSPWDEKYLDEKGEKIIGDYLDIPLTKTTTRIIFFFHFINFSKPLLTQYGELHLSIPTQLPERLKDKLVYEKPD
jgi:hypothetical protein